MEELFQKIPGLSLSAKKIFERLFEVKKEKTKIYLPEQLREKYQQAENQEIVIIRNKILNQETHFNIWRAKRKEPQKESKLLENEYDPFCNPINYTPYDEFGRLENESAITASNLAKSAKNHSLVIFKNHQINQIDIKNSFLLAYQWFLHFQEENRIIIWNYGYRSGASIFHPHLQIFALDTLPLKIDYLFKRFADYQTEYHSNYLDDLFFLSTELDLAQKFDDFNIIVSLTPFKDDEVLFFSENFEDNIHQLACLVYSYLTLGIENFNLFLIETKEILLGFLVNRGESNKINSDIGSLEIYAFSVVGSNPFDLAKKLFVNYWR